MSKKIGDKQSNPSKYRKEYDEQLIAHLATGLSYETFADVVSVCKKTLYDWEKKHPSLLKAKEIGFAKCQLTWERMGLEGTMGKIPFFNSRSWELNMKNRFRWADKIEKEVSGSTEITIKKRLLDD